VRTVRVVPDIDALYRAAAEILISRAEDAARSGDEFFVALSGGNTPLGVYRLLSELPYRGRVRWDRVRLFWGDERCVPPEDPRSNAGNALRIGLGDLSIPPERIHPISCEGTSPAEAALAYETLLKSLTAGREHSFDLAFLGLGEDGHTASLFPGSSPPPEEDDRFVREVLRPPGEPHRVTLLPPIFNRSALVVFLVSGAAKAPALEASLAESGDAGHTPARLIRPDLHSGELLWLVDESAASRLRN
jgi:6-phosphogluconolactonase